MADRRPVVVLALTLVVLLGLVLRASGKPVTTMAHGPKGTVEPARYFYERPGFRAIAFGDGSGNEEPCADILYEWQPGR